MLIRNFKWLLLGERQNAKINIFPLKSIFITTKPSIVCSDHKLHFGFPFYFLFIFVLIYVFIANDIHTFFFLNLISNKYILHFFSGGGKDLDFLNVEIQIQDFFFLNLFLIFHCDALLLLIQK